MYVLKTSKKISNFKNRFQPKWKSKHSKHYYKISCGIKKGVIFPSKSKILSSFLFIYFFNLQIGKTYFLLYKTYNLNVNKNEFILQGIQYLSLK